MASQTKVGPSDSSPPAPASGVEASTGVDPELAVGGDAGEPTSHVASVLSEADGQPGDDEDVSLDELMISGEEDESEEATDAQGVIARPTGALDAPEPVSEPTAVEAVSREVDGAEDGATAFAFDSPEDDEAAALAAAAAAQEAAAQEAADEADARQAAELAARAAHPLGSTGESEAGEPIGGEPPELPVEPASEASSAMFPVDASDAATASSDADDAEPPMSVDLEPPSAAPPPVAPRAVPGDAPLPSFDIPEAEAPAIAAPGAVDVATRRTPRPMAALPPLSEVAEEDDDDAVTHMGLPVVPESSGEYSVGAAAFSIAEPGVAPLPAFEPDLSLTDARRATTRVVPRIDPAELDRRRLASSPVASPGGSRRPLNAWLTGVLERYRPQQAAGAPPPRRRAAWVLDTVLPSLSLILFGSGVGAAGIMLLLQPDRGAKAAQQTQTVQALKEAQKRPSTLAERAEAGEGDALFKITNMAPGERTSALTLALERGYQAQRQNEFKEFARALEAPSGLSGPNLTSRFLGYATSPETMLAAFSHLINWPGSAGPDVLYNVWEKAPGGSRAASLAQQLLHSEDQRAKATPALLTALDLRNATSCEDYLRVLPAVKKSGDQRCSATLRALRHKDGCGDDGKQDCFACLRDGSLLDDALTAIEGRSAPQL